MTNLPDYPPPVPRVAIKSVRMFDTSAKDQKKYERKKCLLKCSILQMLNCSVILHYISITYIKYILYYQWHHHVHMSLKTAIKVQAFFTIFIQCQHVKQIVVWFNEPEKMSTAKRVKTSWVDSGGSKNGNFLQAWCGWEGAELGIKEFYATGGTRLGRRPAAASCHNRRTSAGATATATACAAAPLPSARFCQQAQPALLPRRHGSSALPGWDVNSF